MFVRRSVFVAMQLVSLFFAPQHLFAQQQENISQGGTSANGSYSPGGIDTVSLGNGNLSLNIPILSYPQRGNKLHLSFSLKFTSTPWYFDTSASATSSSDGSIHYDGSWYSQVPGVLTDVGVTLVRDQALTQTELQLTYPCTNTNNECDVSQGPTSPTSTGANLFSLVTADRATHNYGIYAFNPTTGDNTVVPTLDGTNFQPLSAGTAGGGVPSFAGPDGVTYTQVSGAPGFNQADTEGNAITISASGWTDSVGRLIPGSRTGPGSGVPNYNQAVMGDPLPGVVSTDLSRCATSAVAARDWEVPSANGISEPYTLCFTDQVAATAFASPYTETGVEFLTTSQGGGTYRLLSQLVLPNGTSYTFKYDQWLELTSVILPTGGSITYGWQTIQWLTGDPNHNQSRAVKTRTVNNADGTNSVWNYRFIPSPSAYEEMGEAIVTDPAGNDEDHITPGYVNETVNYYSGTNIGNGSRTLLKTIAEFRPLSYLPFDPPSKQLSRAPVPVKSSTTTWAATNEVSEIVYNLTPAQDVQYYNYSDNSSGGTAGGQNIQPFTCSGCLQTFQVQSTQEFDYGSGQPGALVRTSTTQYKWQQDATYKAANLLNIPYSTTVTDASGHTVSQSVYGYDESGSPSGARGELTSVTGLVSGTTTQLISSTSYNANGIVISTGDALGHQTTFSKFDSTGLYPGTVTQPAVGNVQFPTTLTYDFNTGKLLSLTDPNGAQTRWTLDSLTGRLTDIIYADQHKDHFDYVDTVGSVSVKTTTSNGTNTTGQIIRLVDYDGYGRDVKETLQTDPCGADVIDTTYNSLGLLASKSNPYRPSVTGGCSADTTDGTTQYVYDPLRRTQQITLPDRNSSTWSYSGSVTTKIDENMHQISTATDGLGRLRAVKEPDAAANPTGTGTPIVETDYSYDALDNLCQVDQWGGAAGTISSCGAASGTAGNGSDRIRQFQYDGLSRLTSSSNPESGTTTYYYSTGGAICSGDPTVPCLKTDARGITTQYNYDAHNRLTYKGYSNDPSNTPANAYVYDVPIYTGWNFINQTSPPLTGISPQNVIGRLSNTSNANGTVVYGYDAMGRPNLKSVCTPATCGHDHFDMHATYDMSGNLTFEDRGVDIARNASSPNTGHYFGGLNMSYDAAGNLLSATSDIVDSTHPQNIVSSLHFNPLGKISSVQIGDIFGQTRTFNNRAQLSEEDSIDLNGNIPRTDNWGYDNAGNVKTITDTYTGENDFTYDQVNRLYTSSINGNGTTFGYDNWGNLISRTITAGSGYQGSLAVNAKNQQTSCSTCYDAAGNMLNDGTHAYTYDAENRLLSVDGSTTYLYNSIGNRVATYSGGAAQTEYLYDFENRLVVVMDPYTGDLTRAYLYAGGEHWGDYVGSTVGGNSEFRLGDLVGTLVASFDQDGNLKNNCFSGAFGEGLNCDQGVDYTETHYADKKRDQESDLDYSGARFYSSTLSRFMSTDPSVLAHADPSNPQSLNLYSYALNNPLRIIDPTGLTPCDYGSSDQGGRDYEDADSDEECTAHGGSPINYSQNVTVHADNSGSFSLSTVSGGSSTLIQQGRFSASASFAGLSNGACPGTPGFRVSQALQGTANLGLASLKTFLLGAVDLGLNVAAPATGGLSTLASVPFTAYSVFNIAGQASNGAAQIYAAFSGDTAGAADMQQVGDIMQGPVLGLSSLGHGMAAAQARANVESNALGLISNLSTRSVAGSVDFGLSLFGQLEPCH